MGILDKMNKIWGPTGSGPLPTDDLTPPTKDALFAFQMGREKPLELTEESLLVGKICETKQYADSVFRSCQNAHVITSEGLPDTERIDRTLVSKIGIISVPKQRELVNLLFFWEEEIMRLRLLDVEEAEIEAVIKERDRNGGEGVGEREDLETALKIVKAKRVMLPSQRTSDGTAKGEEVLPEYE